MSKPVIDGLEMVEIHVQEREQVPVPPGGGQKVVCAVEEERTVRKPRQGVVERQTLETFLHMFSVRDVLGDADDAPDRASRVAHDRGREENRYVCPILRDVAFF